MKLLKFHLTRQPYELIVILRSVNIYREKNRLFFKWTNKRRGGGRGSWLKTKQRVCCDEPSNFHSFASHVQMLTGYNSMYFCVGTVYILSGL